MESIQTIMNKIEKSIIATTETSISKQSDEKFSYEKLYEYKKYLSKPILCRRIKKKNLLKMKKDIKRKRILTNVDKMYLDIIKIKSRQQKGLIYIKEYFKNIR